MHKVSKDCNLVIQLLHIRLGVNNTFYRTNYLLQKTAYYDSAIQIAAQLSIPKESIYSYHTSNFIIQMF